MYSDSLYLAWAEEDLDDCIFPSEWAEWTENRNKNCRDDFRVDEKNNFFPIVAVLNIRKTKRENQDCSRRSSDALKCLACVVKPIKSQKYKFSSKSLKTRAIED